MEGLILIKRALDIALCLAALVFFAPVMAALAATVYLSSPGPVLYRGLRIGRGGKPFHICKFRSMVANAERVGGSSTSDRDPRITSVGHFMRKYKLDELPQLFNVLWGEMSLVGPRPQVANYVERFSAEERVVLNVRPGITDWASIWNSDEGSVLAPYEDPDAAYDRLIHPTKMKLQIKYAQERTLWVDLKILFYTALCLVRRGWVPPEIRGYEKPWETKTPNHNQFTTVTEVPGAPANSEQWDMLHTRYAWVAEAAEGKEVLEVACGSGIGLSYLATRASRVVGGDCDADLAGIAQTNASSNLDVQVLDAMRLPMEEKSFDVVALLEAIYYLPSPETFFEEAKRVLRPGGKLLICSANCERPDFNPSPFHVQYLTASELCTKLTQAGFSVNCFGAFPLAQSSGLTDSLRETARKMAVRLHLIPKTMKWKSRIKRLFFGPLKPLPSRLEGPLERAVPLHSVAGTQPVPNYKVIYIEAEKSVKEATASMTQKHAA